MANPQITIDQGTLKGTTGTDLNGRRFYSFFGIPYAKPPLGPLRFKAPQPPEKWTGIREATTNTGACYAKSDLQPTSRAGSEDCLVLNVYTPELPNSKAELKPVMVWIHGGAFTSGSNNTMMYGPEYLITEDVVIVAINYRVGLLGFLSFDDPTVGVPGNAGLKDMVMALKWIQGNIKSFGGDPNNVTIFGESAGGAAVHFLVLSPMAKGLFHRAIAQSGCTLNHWALARPSAKDLAKVLNCSSTNDVDILDFLQSLPVDKFYDGQEALKDRIEVNHTRLIGPAVEKITPNEPAFLSEHPLVVLLNGNYNKVPLIMGYTEVEGLLFELFAKQTGKSFVTDFEEFIIPALKLKRGTDASKAVASKIKAFYFGNDEPSQENVFKQYTIQSDASFNYGIQQSIQFHSLGSNEPLYFYRFSVDGSMNFVKKIGNIKHPGACHGDDLGYLFKNFMSPNTLDFDSLEGKTVKRMVKLWTNFAKIGDPNTVENVTWKQVTQEELNCLDIGENLVMVLNPEMERMDFWNNILK